MGLRNGSKRVWGLNFASCARVCARALGFLKGKKKQGVYGCVRDYGSVGIIGVSGINGALTKNGSEQGYKGTET